MNIVLITGPPGSGKSTLAHRLSRATSRVPTGCLEGDAVSITCPGGTGHRRLDLVERNLVACAHNYSIWGAHFLYMTWIFTTEQRMNRFVSCLGRFRWPVMRVVLTADVDRLLQRLANRNGPHLLRDKDAAWLSEMNSRLKQFKADLHIDTSAIDERASVNKVIVSMDAFAKFRERA